MKGLSIQYETLEEAEMRLSGTLVMYDEEPVYITGVGPAAPGDPKPDVFRVYAVPLPAAVLDRGENKKEFRRFISSNKFDLRTIRMGFVNLPDELIYCSRAPAKQYKQGICNATLNCTGVTGRGGKRLSNLVSRQEFVDAIKGRYPSFEKAYHDILEGEQDACAFSRDFGIVGDIELDGLLYLYYKTEKVGFVMDGKVNLSAGTSCLKESLEELGVRI
jgi:hypothetical protein